MSAWSDVETEFQADMKDFGMTTRARVKTKGGSFDVDLTDWQTPDTRRFDGTVQSRDYEMEYLASDLPNLKEGESVKLLDDDDEPIAKESYIVREPPYVTDNLSDSRTGVYRRVRLTKL